MNSKFTRSRSFLAFWMILFSLPYLIAFLFRLATEPSWNQGCFGCNYFQSDWITMIVLNGVMVFLLLVLNGGAKYDPLMIYHEGILSMALPLAFFILTLILYAIDPNQVQAQGLVSWRALDVVGLFFTVYFQTFHQVFLSRFLQTKLIYLQNLNLTDRFRDVMADKKLKAELRDHLYAELSGEVLNFLDAVEIYRKTCAKSEDLMAVEAKQIYSKFIEQNVAPQEVNLSSAVRAAITLDNVSITMFDPAFEEVKDNLLRDGFTRFVNPKRLRNRTVSSHLSTRVTNMLETGEAVV
jgi:hypothetical protein